MSASTGFTGRQINLVLEALLLTAILSGLLSWSVGDRWSGALTFVHGASGIALALMLPAKFRGPVRAGFRRGRATRWLSSLFGIQILATLILGVLHATGLWYGVGQWTALWTHELFAFALLPLLIWHIVSRPARVSLKAVHHDRRAMLRISGVAAAAAALHVAQRVSVGAVGLAGGERRGTGSHEVGSHDPDRMPAVIWLNDHAPATADAEGWALVIDKAEVTVASLAVLSTPIKATLDCTGGWYSEQNWDAVPLSALITAPAGRSVYVESATGYGRHFSIGDLDGLFLATGYEGQPLRRSHGAPVRLVVPGRRGPEWIKWVVKVECSDRPPWLQSPLPLS